MLLGSRMKCYLINLDRSEDRLTHMAHQFARLGIEFERISAFDGRALSASEIAAASAPDRRWKPGLTPAEIGCFFSHRRCLEAIAAGSEPFAIVVEDDIAFADDAADLLTRSDWIPRDADIVKIETQGKKVLIDRPVACSESQYSIARLHSTHILSAGYIVSRDAAKRIVAKMEKVSAPIDHFLFNPAFGIFEQLVIYQCTPALCRQAGLTSTLNAERKQTYVRPTLPSRLLRETMRVFRRVRIGIWGIWVNITTEKRWQRVPFARSFDQRRIV